MFKKTRRHTGKMKGVHSYNTSPLTNSFCAKMRSIPGLICSSCYSCRMLETCYANTSTPGRFKENGETVSTRMLEESEIIKSRVKYIRFQAHGELINRTHLLNLVKIAKTNPAVQFSLFTKRMDLIQSLLPGTIPPNVVVVYSEPRINVEYPVLPNGADKVFCVYTKNFVRKNAIQLNCAGKHCKQCHKCYEHGTDVIIRELIH